MSQSGSPAANSESLRTWKLLESCAASAKYFGILSALIAVGYFGHLTHWDFGITKHAADESHETAKTSAQLEGEAIADAWEVEFPSANSLEQSGIKTVPIERREMRERVKTMGVVTYDERMSATISPRVSGSVWRVVKQVGDPVKRGDVLVIIEAADVGRAKAEFLTELVSVESRTEILNTLEKITGAVAGKQIREAAVAMRESKIRLQNAEQNLVNLGFAVRKEDFQLLSDTDRSTKLHFLGLPESIVSDLDPARTTSNLLALTSPFEGVVIRNDVALGEMVDAGKPVFEIADLRRMWLKLDVPKEDASKLMLGQRVSFVPDGLEESLDSTITWISTEMNELTRTLRVRAEVDNPVVSSNSATGHEVRMLRANTFGTGTIMLRESNAGFVVPVSAILHADNQAMVFVKDEELSFMRIDVKVGVRDGKYIQIESDRLEPDMEVVVQGSHVLKSEWVLNHVASAQP